MILKVYYGYSKLTKKVMRKPELSIIFENSNYSKNEESIKRWLYEIVYVRNQSEAEMSDAEGAIRIFTKYRYLILEEPWNGDIDKVLEDNFEADSNHVSEEERNIIKQKLLTGYSHYKYKYEKKGVWPTEKK